MAHELEFGLDTFLPVTVDAAGQPIPGDVVIRNTVEEAVLADSVGIDSFNIGEHYRTDFMDSATHVVLAAIAGRTERIRLGTAVTVLSTQDPVRVYTDFATLDAVSNGRAQLIVGRGSLTDSFPLFGFDLADYEELFEEKLDLLTRLLRDQPVTWSGDFRAAAHRTSSSARRCRPVISRPGWASVAARNSVLRAARYGLPLMLAIIGGRPERFAPLRRPLPARARAVRAAAAADRPALARLRRRDRRGGHRDPVAVLGAVRLGGARTRLAAADLRAVPRGGRSRLDVPWLARDRRDADRERRSQALRLSRFDLLYALGRVPHEQRMATIELYGREVIPRVRELLAEPG